MLFTRYKEEIKKLPLKETYTKEDLLHPGLLIEKYGALQIYYSPHNEYVNSRAQVLILGITPGWAQMNKSITLARHLIGKVPDSEMLKRVKAEGRFSGPMRKNLAEMLDSIGLAECLGIDYSMKLFHDDDSILHTSSLVKYPVFNKGNNYTGHDPELSRSPFLLSYAEETFRTDIQPLDSPLIIPLGKAADSILEGWINSGLIKPELCLSGFPHPSGANGHRFRHLEEKKEELAGKIRKYFS
ncbi:hypothetical protein [Bacillus sp. UMB0728]|uniref:hypothetical protein n=1 Tax=Bacillus sp. UMB0728 TaxID=2066052 RepID=UPI000C77755F|nr:hypothetical protein [Bacillus sp. UMB0728]PLR72582.1 hypothetical protein CYJ37_13675 [Bacillus sp. UMB0728]